MTCFDTHTHTYLSNHGKGTVDEVVAEAARRGLAMVALTEHLPLPAGIDPDGTFAMDADKVGFYFDSIAQARLDHPQIEVITGVEIDWRTGAEDYILQQLASAPGCFELRLGSVHMLSDGQGSYWEFDHPAYVDGWYERGEKQVWKAYLATWIEAVRSSVPFDVMTHPDLPKKLDFRPKFDTREMYTAMAEAAATRGVMIEVNTSGLRKPVDELFPADALLKAFCEAGVMCTIGSDAHVPRDVGCDFDSACASMRRAGYTHVTMPTRSGDRRPVPLDEFEASWKRGFSQ